MEGKVSPSPDFTLLKSIQKFELVKASDDIIEIIYIPITGRGVVRRQLTIQGGTLSEPVALVMPSKSIVSWISCKKDNSETPNSTVNCAYGGIGSEITWGSYDASSETITFTEAGNGLRISKVGSKPAAGFFGKKYVLSVIDINEKDTSITTVVQATKIVQAVEVKESSQVLSLVREENKDKKETQYQYRLIGSFTR
jgi:hypothetical protein